MPPATATLISGASSTISGLATGTSATFTFSGPAGVTFSPASGLVTNPINIATFVTAANAGTYTVTLTLTGGVTGVTSTTTTSITVQAIANYACTQCHGSSPQAIAYATSIHAQSSESTCQGCHNPSGTKEHPFDVKAATVNPATFVTLRNISTSTGFVPTGAIFCTVCHTGKYPIPHPTDLNPGVTCTACHTDPLGQGNGTGDAHSIQPLPGCVNCHAVKQAQVAPSLVNDNNGVRQIVGAGGEFQQWSHHIINDINNSVDPQNGQCAVCHLEGKGSTGSVDSTKHMVDGNIHLRDCNTTLNQSQSSGGEFTWNPASPNHTAMDQFCMSCHNAAGAVSAPTPTGTPRTASPLNPFGDLIQNNYDGLSRGAVVAVYDQFDPSNTSHHAVRAARYNVSTAGTPGSLIPAFANISANNANAPAPYTAKGLRYANGTSYVGTMSDTGKFITTYKPLVNNNGSFTNLADNSQLHCADCHTVGQWAARGTDAFKAYSTAYGPGVTKYYKQAIGAHGSGNEYMLRNNNGDNTLNPLALVCYNCHASSLYGSGSASTATRVKFAISGITSAGVPAGTGAMAPGVSWTMYNYTSASRAVGPYGTGLLNDLGTQKLGAAATTATAHDGVAGTMGANHCNDDQNNTAGLTGLARLNNDGQATASFLSYSAGHSSNGKSGGNAFGIKCANCHNSGDGTNPGYGGIHGNAFRVGSTTTVIKNAAYTTYSSTTAGTGTGSTWATTTHQPYRFLPGLGNFRYNGGSDSTMSNFVSGRSGCYTLNGTGTDAGPTYAKNAGAGRYKGPAGTAAAGTQIADDNGLLGTWGSCTEHTNNNHIPTRNVLRPTSY
jgi:hypothetical protein